MNRPSLKLKTCQKISANSPRCTESAFRWPKERFSGFLCHRIGFIVGGEIVKIDRVQDLLNEAQQKKTVEFVIAQARPDLEAILLAHFPQFTVEQSVPQRIRISAAAEIPLMPLLRLFAEHGIDVLEARRLRPSLEEVFVKITGLEISKMKAEKEGGKK